MINFTSFALALNHNASKTLTCKNVFIYIFAHGGREQKFLKLNKNKINIKK